MIKIVPYKLEYAESIHYINEAVSTHPDRSEKEKALCRYLYSDYYLQNSSENCFCAIDDENNEVVGYIIGEPNFSRFNNIMLNEYILVAQELDHSFKKVLEDEMIPYQKWNEEYEAHIHMDVKPGYQNQGVGSLLIEYIQKHIKEKGRNGIMLLCSKKNERANYFYQKHGFDIVDEYDCYVRAKKL